MDNDLRTPDPLQSQDDHFSPTNDEIKLSEDNDTPFTPADDVPAPVLPSDHPATDDGVDEHEAYDEGTAHAAGVNGTETTPDTNVRRIELFHDDSDD